MTHRVPVAEPPNHGAPLLLTTNAELFLHLLRAIAAQMVVFGHAIMLFEIWPALQPPQFVYIQKMGVAIFFFLSGFVISYTCQRKMSQRTYGFDEFLFDRAVRIYIVLIPSLIFIAACDGFCWLYWKCDFEFQSDFTFQAAAANLMFLQLYPQRYFDHSFAGGWLTQSVLGSGRSLWTLAVEWWLYVEFGWLMLPAAGSVWRRWGGRVLAMVSLPVVVHATFGGRDTGFALLWIMGVLVMHVMQGRTLPQWDSRWLALVGCTTFVLSFACPAIPKEGYHFRMNVCFSLAIAILLLAHQNLRFSVYERLRVATAIRFFADYSFTLYLTHYTILHWARVLWGTRVSQEVGVLCVILLSNVIAIAIAWVTEFKYRVLREWLAPFLFTRAAQSVSDADT